MIQFLKTLSKVSDLVTSYLRGVGRYEGLSKEQKSSLWLDTIRELVACGLPLDYRINFNLSHLVAECWKDYLVECTLAQFSLLLGSTSVVEFVINKVKKATGYTNKKNDLKI